MPNRILKESICTSDSIDSLSWFEEVLFYRLIVNCDDFGRFDGRIPVIKNRLFPLKENLTVKTVSAAINTLASAGLVALYEFEGKPYLYLPTWNEHQNVRAKRSKYPEPDESCTHMNTDDIKCNQMNADVPVIQSNPNPIRNPNPNAEDTPAPKGQPKHKHGLYGNVLLSDEDMEKLKAEFPEDCGSRIDRLSEYMASTGKGYKNHLATIRNWARRDIESGKVPASNPDAYTLGESELQSIANLQRLRDSLAGGGS